MHLQAYIELYKSPHQHIYLSFCWHFIYLFINSVLFKGSLADYLNWIGLCLPYEGLLQPGSGFSLVLFLSFLSQRFKTFSNWFKAQDYATSVINNPHTSTNPRRRPWWKSYDSLHRDDWYCGFFHPSFNLENWAPTFIIFLQPCACRNARLGVGLRMRLDRNPLISLNF